MQKSITATAITSNYRNYPGRETVYKADKQQKSLRL